MSKIENKYWENKHRDLIDSASQYLCYKYNAKNIDKSNLIRKINKGDNKNKYDDIVSVIEISNFSGLYLKELEYNLPEFDLWILIGKTFPFHAPSFMVNPSNILFLKYPHIEKDGRICLKSYSIVDNDRIEDIIDYFLKPAGELTNFFTMISDSTSREKEFKRELPSYWNLIETDFSSTRKLQKIDSIIEINAIKDSKSAIYMLKKAQKPNSKNANILIAEDHASMQKWLNNTGDAAGTFCNKVLLLYSDNIEDVFCTPEDYPRTIDDLETLIKEKYSSVYSKFLEIKTKQSPLILVIFLFKIKEGYILVGDNINPAKNELQPIKIIRRDPSWILGRDSRGNIEDLLKQKVTIIGCGAIGSSLARLLAQEGIGNINLIDHDNFSEENIVRHNLGATALGKGNKARALGAALSADFPHINITPYAEKWEDAVLIEEDLFDQCSLIISAMADINSENMLNSFIQENNIPTPVVYSWAEAYACAGHAIVVIKDRGCFNCAYQYKFNIPKLELSSNSNNGQSEIIYPPGCSQGFNPFGNTELTPIIALIVSTCMRVINKEIDSFMIRSWLGPKNSLKNYNYEWTEHAKKLFEKHKLKEGFIVESDLDKYDNCKYCGQVKQDDI